MLKMVFNSSPVEFGQRSILLDVQGSMKEIPNDYVWVLAGGIPPSEFLRKVGVVMGQRDLAIEALDEANLVRKAV